MYPILPPKIAKITITIVNFSAWSLDKMIFLFFEAVTIK
jgi:hypothetical protein